MTQLIKEIKIWFYCKFCMLRTTQVFRYDDGIYEVYECQICGRQNSVAVR